MRLLTWISLLIILVVGIAPGYVLDLTKVNWRMVDVVALLLGSVGIVTLIGESQRLVPGHMMEYMRSRPESWLSTLNNSLTNYVKIVEGRIARTQSQDPKAAILSEYATAQDWFRKGAKLSTITGADPLPDLSSWLQSFPQGLADREILLFKEEIDQIASNSLVAIEEFRDLKAKTEKGLVETLVTYVAPIPVSVALGLALFKALFAPG